MIVYQQPENPLSPSSPTTSLEVCVWNQKDPDGEALATLNSPKFFLDKTA